MSVLNYLRQTADPRWITVDPGTSPLRLTAQMALPDGEPVIFRLRIEAPSGTPSVWEDGSTHLPACPARHFYADGSFCMGIGLDGPPPVLNLELAHRWWAVLRGYLQLQIIASLTGEWPPQHARAHGQTAAGLEMVAEWAESMLPERLVAAIRTGSLELGDKPGRLKNRRQLCPCGSRSMLKWCHEGVIVGLLTSRQQQAAMEKVFWSQYSGRECCGTMLDCPLRKSEKMVVEERVS